MHAEEEEPTESRDQDKEREILQKPDELEQQLGRNLNELLQRYKPSTSGGAEFGLRGLHHWRRVGRDSCFR